MAPQRSDVTIRRVPFRHGTDADLAALHSVETPIEAERRPDRVPQPLDAYISFARALPAQYSDHTWLVERADGAPVATAACWSNAAGDPNAMECDLFVGRDVRRQGIGSRLLRLICDACVIEGRSLLFWGTFDAVPAGDAFSRRLGARVARVARTSELRLDAVDWAMVDRWISEAEERAGEYRCEWVDGPFPDALLADAATFHHIMNSQPHDDLDVGDVLYSEADIAEVDRSLTASGRLRWSLLVRDEHGACVGGTEVHFEPWEPSTVLQQNTGIDPAHRGRGLAKWAKAAMLDRIRRDCPEAARVRTGNAFSNAPMLAINDALGFVVISSRTEWQIDVAAALEVLDRR
jgi:GNAT superfamily N-acetyltransferase